MCLDDGEYMISEVVYTGGATVVLLQNQYAAGDAVELYYRTAATEGGCLAAAWTLYAAQFESTGYVQARAEYLA